jgi:hypothetical protein
MMIGQAKSKSKGLMTGEIESQEINDVVNINIFSGILVCAITVNVAIELNQCTTGLSAMMIVQNQGLLVAIISFFWAETDTCVSTSHEHDRSSTSE